MGFYQSSVMALARGLSVLALVSAGLGSSVGWAACPDGTAGTKSYGYDGTYKYDCGGGSVQGPTQSGAPLGGGTGANDGWTKLMAPAEKAGP